MNYFLDTEFNEHRGSLLSMAVVREDGKAVYFELDLPPGEPLGSWVKEHVVPKMSQRFILLEQAQELLQSFFAGDTAPRIYCDWPTDIEWFCWAMDLGGGKRILGRHIEMVIAPDLVSSDASAIPHHALADAVAMCKQFLAAKSAEGAEQEGPTVPDVTKASGSDQPDRFSEWGEGDVSWAKEAAGSIGSREESASRATSAADERAAFETEWQKVPDFAPEFEPHRAWAKHLGWLLWSARAALTTPSAAPPASQTMNPDPPPLSPYPGSESDEITLPRWLTTPSAVDPGAATRLGRHGVDCVKASHHRGVGYLHKPDDDTPYEVDGCRYCGRCHQFIGV